MAANQNVSYIYDKTNIPTVSSSASGIVIRQRILNTTRSLTGTQVIKKKKGKKSTRLLKVDSTEIKTTPISFLESEEKMKRVPAYDVTSLARNEGGGKKLNKAPGDICDECLSTSARNQSGQVEPLLQCTGECGIALHSSCLAIICSGTWIAPGSRWSCQDCRTCSAIPSCSVTERKYLLKCDTCDRGYHLQCLQPPAAAGKPKSAWRCSFCLDHPDTTVSAIKVEPFEEREGRKKSSLETQSLISNIRKRKNPNTIKNENTNEEDNGIKLNNRYEKKKKKIDELGYWTVRLDLMPNENVPQNLISNFCKRENQNTVENENTNEIDNSDEQNIKHEKKKQNIDELGYWTVRLDLMPNENVPQNLTSNVCKRENPNNEKNENINEEDDGVKLNNRHEMKKQKIDELGYWTVRLDRMPDNLISNARKRKNPNTVENENTNEIDNSDEQNIKHEKKKQKIDELGYWTVRLDRMPDNLISNARKRKNPNTVENEYTNEIDISDEQNIKHEKKKQKIDELGYWTVRLNRMPDNLISNARKRKNPNTVENEYTNEIDISDEQNIKHEKKKQKIDELGYWTVRLNRMPDNLISNARKRKNPNTVENEYTNEIDNSDEQNIKHEKKKQKIDELGYWTVRLDRMSIENVANYCDKTNFIQTDVDSVSNAIRLNRRNITPSLIETPVLQHSSGRKALLAKADSNDIETTSSLHTAGRKKKMILPDASDKKLKKGSAISINVESFAEHEGRKKSNLKTQRSSHGRSLEIKVQDVKLGTPSSSLNRRDDTTDVLGNMSDPVVSAVVPDDVEICEKTKTRANDSTIQTPVRCPAAIQFGEFEVETWFSCPFPEEQAPKLYFCEFCLKCTKSKSVLERHTRCCNIRQPPGIEIYRSGDLSVFEVDGNTNKTYCQTLCRIGKLFLDHKTLYYGVEPFLFYMLTKNDGLGCHLVGYFSKEKHNEDNCNVACILAMPQYQRQGYGRFLIEFSYLLSKTEKQPGTPEKPLSCLGQLSYNAYWKSTILEYLANHRNSENLCINDISSETGLARHDITNTFNSLNMVVEIFNEITICIDWSIVDDHIKRKNTSNKIHIKPDCLSWIPATKSSNLLFSQDGKDGKPFLIKCIA